MDTSTCPLCKHEYWGHCKTCHPLYEEDIRTGHIPLQFIEAGVKLSFTDWALIKQAELKALSAAEMVEQCPWDKAGPARAEEAKRNIESVIYDCLRTTINTRPAVKQANEQKRKQSFIERLRKAQTY